MAGGYEVLKSEDASSKERLYRVSGTMTRRLGLIFVFILAFATLSVIHVHPSSLSADLGPNKLSNADASPQIPLGQCASHIPLAAKPPAPINPWSSLSVEETVQIQKWLETPERGLNLTRGDVARMSDNVIFMIEVYYPPKDEVLSYLASPSSAPVPRRNARVTIQHGADIDPVVKDYLVGPLPVGFETTMMELNDIYHRDAVPFNARGPDHDWTFPELAQLMAPMAEAVEVLCGGTAIGMPNDTLVAGGSGPFSFDGSFRRLWILWRRNTSGHYLHPLNFWQYVDISGNDPSLWKILKIVYDHQVFDSTESFMEAFHNGTLERLPPVVDESSDLSFSTRKRIGKQNDLDNIPGPRSVSFAGVRYRVDRDLQYVSWQGWSMYLGFDRDMGLNLWDIRFREERIIYQLAPQEALAQYAGHDPFQSSTVWLDRYFGMGQAVRDLLPGYDCPHEATYLPAKTYSSLGIISRERAICVFEHDSGRPITRHTGYGASEFGAVKGFQLVVRSISTVGNYDYLFDYIFHLDGTVEVRVSASGYLQAAYQDKTHLGYGTRIWDTTMGSLHDHVINFKVDLDVAGVENSLLHTSLSQEEVVQPWFDEDWGQTVLQQKITREYVTNENDALLKFATNFQGGYSIVNQEQTNKWGTPRGYTVHPGYSPIHNTVVGSKRVLDNANWARYNLAVSRRKETEPSSSNRLNFNLPGAPVVDFHKFFDGENITQEDLVLWINVGMHHLPHAEDAPNTKTNIAASSFLLTPTSYFDYDVSIDSSNAIVLTAPSNPGDPFTYDDYGVSPAHCIPQAPAPFKYAPVQLFSLDGALAPPATVDELRKQAEMYHRIKLEL